MSSELSALLSSHEGKRFLVLPSQFDALYNPDISSNQIIWDRIGTDARRCKDDKA